MKKLALLLALAMAFPLAASKDKDKNKHKDKRFEPVEVTAAQAAGRNVGGGPGEVVLELTPNGGTLVNFGRTATLKDVVFDGSEMRATAVYRDGGTQPLDVQFVNRIKNGETTFGLLLRNIDIHLSDAMMIQNLFCARQ